MNRLYFILPLVFSVRLIYCQFPNLEHEEYLKCEKEIKEIIFPKPINNDSIKPFSINSFNNQNTIFHFWVKSENQDIFFENELIRLQTLQKKYQDSVRIIIITNTNQKIINPIIHNFKLDIPIVLDSLHKNLLHYETPFSVYYDSKGNLNSISYSTFILETIIDKVIFGKNTISPEYSMMWTCQYPLKKYKFPAPYKNKELGSFCINDLISRQIVLYLWPDYDCYFCLSNLLLANDLHFKYKKSIQFVVISNLPESKATEIIKKYNITLPWVIDDNYRNILPNNNPLFLAYSSNGTLLSYEISGHIMQGRIESYFKDGTLIKN